VSYLRNFEYFEPESLEEAVKLKLKYDPEEAKVLAGGVDLVPRMRRRQILPKCVISLHRISGLDYIESNGKSGLRIGALTSIRSIELSSAIQRDYKVLYEAVHQIASIQVKTMSTAVGNLCVASPASDVALSLFVLGAKLRLIGRTSERVIPIEDFYVGLNQTSLRPDEIAAEIILPSSTAQLSCAFLRLTRTATDCPKVNVAVTMKVVDNRCKNVNIALGCVAPTPIRAQKAEDKLRGQIPGEKLIEAAADAAAEATKSITDIRSTAEYRKEMICVLTRRAIEKSLNMKGESYRRGDMQ